MIRLRLSIFGKNTTEVMLYPSDFIMTGYMMWACLLTGDVNLDHMVTLTSARFLHCKMPPTLPFGINKYLGVERLSEIMQIA